MMSKGKNRTMRHVLGALFIEISNPGSLCLYLPAFAIGLILKDQYNLLDETSFTPLELMNRHSNGKQLQE